ncbi:MAG: phospholipid carrier-dependent glycosyltransferase [Deltaproteobacteria bacterium]|nr:MAG: phospholipid carrier-dependent glycosyltransferase [Deltaproteobacteria bacterium]
MTRLPNALAGGLSVFVVALLGRRLFGRTAGLLAAGLAAFSVTLIGYQRVAKEDTLLGLFLMLLLWCMAEAHAEPRERRWELGAAASLAGMLASKYFFFLTPIPVVFYLWSGGWGVPLKRWVFLIGAGGSTRAATRPGSRRCTARSSSWGASTTTSSSSSSTARRRGSMRCSRRSSWRP